jgi:hypothetical protein
LDRIFVESRHSRLQHLTSRARLPASSILGQFSMNYAIRDCDVVIAPNIPDDLEPLVHVRL